MKSKKKFPRYLAPSGQIYTCIAYAVSIRSGWEWYGFEVVHKEENNTTYFGYVMGFDSEFGNFSSAELKENNIPLCTEVNDLLEIAPPIGWFRHDN